MHELGAIMLVVSTFIGGIAIIYGIIMLVNNEDKTQLLLVIAYILWTALGASLLF